jgi:hypothetical protein
MQAHCAANRIPSAHEGFMRSRVDSRVHGQETFALLVINACLAESMHCIHPITNQKKMHKNSHSLHFSTSSQATNILWASVHGALSRCPSLFM